jgi:hypothetical protein
VGKYEAMGLTYPFRDTPPLPLTEAQRIADELSRYFTVSIEK